MAILIPNGAKKFKASIVWLSIWEFLVSAALMTCLILIQDGSKIDVRAFIHAIIFVLFLSCIMAWILSVFFPAWLSADGIYGYSIWGVRRFIQWQNIASVRRFTLLKLSRIRIYSSIGGKVTWLPLFQSRPSEFWQTIKEFAPLGSPILIHFDN
jgi:hypothetical protein